MSETKIIRPQIGFQEMFVRSNVDFVVGGGILGAGKMLGIDELVLTPDGWVRNGDLEEGQYVCTPFGKPARILRIFDHKDKDIYTLETTDGRKSECGLEHLWAFRTKKQKQKYRKHLEKTRNITVETTEHLMERMKNGQPCFLPLCNAIEFEEKEYLIPPYVLGVMIGDGCLTKSVFKSNASFPISNPEKDIIDRVAKKTTAEKVVENSKSYTKHFYSPNSEKYRRYLEKVGLNTYSYDKFIPKEYLEGSVSQRRDLLAGLFDTDGNVGNKNTLRFSTTSERLRDDFIYLCRSLGYKATYSTDKRTHKYTTGKMFTVYIHTDDIIFSSFKHFERYTRNIYKYRYGYKETTDHVRIRSITYNGKSDARCILLDDEDQLYITNDFIVTHNSFAAVLSVAEPSLDPNFRGLFLRNNLDDLRSGGGLLDNFREAYGASVDVVESGAPRVTFPSGARIDVTHVADQSKEKVLQRFKGRQYDFIYFDELTGFSWDCFTTIFSRNRGKAKWTGKIRGTTNPDRDHWLRVWLDWYIGADGYIREDRNGVVRYFYMAGESVKDVVWGDSKEEVYGKCRIQIDRVLSKINGKTGTSTYEELIKSFTFYLGKMSENKAMMDKNEGYIGSVAVSGGRNAQQLLEGNWNVSTNGDLSSPIKAEMANLVFVNDAQINNDRWITADLADVGTDNFIALSWNGLHVDDILIITKSTPKQNAEMLKQFAINHDVADNHIIYDAVRGVYINDYIEEAVPFVSYRQPMGIYGRMAVKLKDECYLRLVELINRRLISIDEKIGDSIYEHQAMKDRISVQTEFVEECSVVRFNEGQSGKKSLLSKKEMNNKLGKNRSMDLLDPCAMRMMPLLGFAYGEELAMTGVISDDDGRDADDEKIDVYDDSNWF